MSGGGGARLYAGYLGIYGRIFLEGANRDCPQNVMWFTLPRGYAVTNMKKVVMLNNRKFKQPVCPQIMITFSRSLEGMQL